MRGKRGDHRPMVPPRRQTGNRHCPDGARTRDVDRKAAAGEHELIGRQAVARRHDLLHAALLEELEAEVRAAQREAEQSGTLVTSTIDFPQDVTTMFEDVFEEMPWHLREQQVQMVAELEAKRK